MNSNTLALACAFLLSSCVTNAQYAQDMRDLNLTLEDATADQMARVAAMTKEVSEAAEQRDAALAEKAGQLPTDPVSLLVYGGGLLASVLGTDKYRDSKRKKRGEQV